SGLGRTLLAWCTIQVASHSTRLWMLSSVESVSRSSTGDFTFEPVGGGRGGAAVRPPPDRSINQLTFMVTTADIPARSGCGFPISLALSRILTGTRWTTLTQLPVAFSGGRREKRETVPA